MAPRITVCVPVYQGARFVADTLAAIRGQTIADIRVLVAIDRGTDGSVDACRPFLADPRFTILVHRDRQGWVGNANALMARVETEFFCLLPHDDLIAPDYLEALLGCLDRHPAAVAAYCDLEGFEDASYSLQQPELRGGRFERLRDGLAFHFDAIPYRGLIRRSALGGGLPLSGNRCGDFAADTVWMLRLAGLGELRRVPRPLYRKRVHRLAETQRWYGWDDAVALDAWVEHCAQCWGLVDEAGFAPDERAALWFTVLARLLQRTAPLWTRLDGGTRPAVSMAAPVAAERRTRVAALMARLAALGMGAPPEQDLAAVALSPRLAPVLGAILTREAGDLPDDAPPGRRVAALRRAIAAAPDRGEPYRRLSNVALGLDCGLAPVMVLLRGIRAEPLAGQRPSLPPLALSLAQLRERNGAGGRAQAVLRQALAVEPGSAPLMRALARFAAGGPAARLLARAVALEAVPARYATTHKGDA